MIIGDIPTKTAFADATQGAVESLDQALSQLQDLQATYLSRGYDPGSPDAIVDADIVDSKITASQLSQILQAACLISKFNALMSEPAVVGTIQGNVIMDKVRSDI